jgi:hypothetical protein
MRLSCRRVFAANVVRLQLHALAYNITNFPRHTGDARAGHHWSLSSLKAKLIKIGPKLISHRAAHPARRSSCLSLKRPGAELDGNQTRADEQTDPRSPLLAGRAHGAPSPKRLSSAL